MYKSKEANYLKVEGWQNICKYYPPNGGKSILDKIDFIIQTNKNMDEL